MPGCTVNVRSESTTTAQGEECTRVTCSKNLSNGEWEHHVEVEVREVDGALIVIISGGKVTIEPRAAGIWMKIGPK